MEGKYVSPYAQNSEKPITIPFNSNIPSTEVKGRSETESFSISLENAPYYAKNEYPSLLYFNMKPALKNLSQADICFICDTTGDMSGYIELLKKTMKSIIGKIKGFVNSDPRVSLIEFKDFADRKDQIKVKNFTTNLSEIEEAFGKIKCGGGYDACEDLVLPLTKALSLDWKSDLKYVYLVMGAPAHGKKYHSNKIIDDFMEKDKDKLLEKLACHYRRNKINLVIIRCNDTVDMTINAIREYYDSPLNTLSIIDLSTKEEAKSNIEKNFASMVVKQLKVDTYSNFKEIGDTINENAAIDSNFFLHFPKDCTCHIYESNIIPPLYNENRYRYKFDMKKSEEVKCQISSVPISIGFFSDMYYMKIIEEEKSKDKKEYIQYVAKPFPASIKSAKEVKYALETNALAQHFIDKFNNYNIRVERGLKRSIFKPDTNSESESAHLKLLPMYLMEVDETEHFNGSKVFAIQPFIEGDVYRFNNNYGWVFNTEYDFSDLANAFSHFTYEFSLGSLIIVNIQGLMNEKMLLLNPTIHSALYSGLYNERNHGKLGIMKFITSHKCNDYCKKLFLTNVNIVKDPLHKMIAERKLETELPYLYKDVEKELTEWQEDIRAKIKKFNREEAPTTAGEESSKDKSTTATSETGLDEGTAK